MVIRESDKIDVEIPSKDITETGSGVVVYKRTSGRKLVITELVLTNESSGKAVIEGFDGAPTDGRQKFSIQIPANDNKVLDSETFKRMVEFGDFQVQTDSQPVNISGNGFEY